MNINESDFKKKVEKFLEDEGFWYIKYWGGGGFTKSGIPDILACVHGHFFGIELKVRPNKPTKLQWYHLDKIEAAEGIAIVLYPEDFEIFKNLCRKLQPTIKTESERFLIDIQQTINEERKKYYAKENRTKEN